MSNIKDKTASNEAADKAIKEHMADMERQVREMPLSTWLYAIHRSIPHIGKDHAMREFVCGLHKRGLAFHWDDCANDCLSGIVSTEDGDTINSIVEQLHCEEMFTLSLQLLQDEPNAQVEEVLKRFPSTGAAIKPCTCDVRDLMTHGCKCGGC